MATIAVARQEALMGTKDKGGRNVKTAATRTLKEKRLAKKSKKGAHGSGSNESVDKAFGR